jgi:hypothetical protein
LWGGLRKNMGEQRIWVLAHLTTTADVKIDTTPRLNRLCWPKSAENVTKPTGIGTACSFLDLSWLRGNRLLEGGIKKALNTAPIAYFRRLRRHLRTSFNYCSRSALYNMFMFPVSYLRMQCS